MTESAKPGTKLSVIMPAYNEAGNVRQTIADLCGTLDNAGIPYEVLVVDDASSDDTGAVLVECERDFAHVRALANTGDNGYGNAIRYGIGRMGGDAFVVVTSDGADAPKDVVAFYGRIEAGADCVFGERFGPGSTVVGYPWFKKVVNRAANQLIGIVVGSSYRDFTNGFKCYRRAVLQDTQPLISGQFNITVEMSMNAVLGGWRYGVVPNDWKQRASGHSSFSIRKQFIPYAATVLYCLSRAYLRRRAKARRNTTAP